MVWCNVSIVPGVNISGPRSPTSEGLRPGIRPPLAAV